MLNDALSAGAGCYRLYDHFHLYRRTGRLSRGTHICVSMVTDRLSPRGQNRRDCQRSADAGGVRDYLRASYALCEAMWLQPQASLPAVTFGQMYLPIPVGALLTILFVIERLLCGDQSARPLVSLGGTH